MAEKENNGNELQPYDSKTGEYLPSKKTYLESRREIGSNVELLIKLNDGNVSNVLKNVLQNAGMKFSKHCASESIENRNILTADVIDCLINEPLKISEVKYKPPLNLPSYERIGTNVTLVINPDTNVIVTVYPTKYKTYKKLTEESK